MDLLRFWGGNFWDMEERAGCMDYGTDRREIIRDIMKRVTRLCSLRSYHQPSLRSAHSQHCICNRVSLNQVYRVLFDDGFPHSRI